MTVLSLQSEDPDAQMLEMLFVLDTVVAVIAKNC